MEAHELSCPICAGSVPAEEAVACARCSCPHHQDCWEFGGGCSRFGCGEQRWVHYRCVPRELVSGRIEIDAGHPVPAPYRRALVSGMIRTRAGQMSRSVATGLLGGAGAVIMMYLQQGSAPYDLVLMFLGMGIAFGVLAPFLAPHQVRRPGTTTAVAALTVLGLFLYGDSVSRITPLFIYGLIAGIGVTSIIAGATLSEWILGRRRELGILLGRAATPLRYLVTGAGSAAVIIVSLMLSRQGAFELRWIMETAPFALAAMLAAGYPLEKAKDALLEAADRRQLGPASANQSS